MSSTNDCQHKKTHGFTILELLVVIVVIGILAAITVVSFVGIQQRATDASMRANLRNSQTKLAVYYSSNNDTYPPNVDSINFPQDANATYTYYTTPTGYCIGLTNKNNPSQALYISSEVGSIESGVCAKKWKQLSMGYYHVCGVATDGLSYCWGYGLTGALGHNSVNSSYAPVAVNTSQGVSPLYGKTIKSISSGNYHTCAIASDDNLYCWGSNGYGQLGDNTTDQKNIPVAVNKVNGVSALYGKTVKSVSAGAASTCAIASDNKAYCWGYNNFGNVGDGTTGNNRLVPVAVDTTNLPGDKTVKDINADGSYHTCAIASDDNAYCWGRNDNGQIGDNTTGTNRLIPVAVNNANGVSALYNKTVKKIVGGFINTCAVGNDDKAYCWGYNYYGQLGDNTNTQRMAPVAVNDTNGVSPLYNKTILNIETAYYHTCALASDNRVYCWGYNYEGELGNNSTTDSHIPVAVNTESGVSDLYNLDVSSVLSSQGNFSCAFAINKNVYCWGAGAYGALGNGDTNDRHVPTLVGAIPN